MCCRMGGVSLIADFAQRYSNVRHPDLMVGIPLILRRVDRHTTTSSRRTARSMRLSAAFSTSNASGSALKFASSSTSRHMNVCLMLARFIARNLLFVDHVALMGLEITGFTRFNSERPLD